ncbi:hypothetical protein [Asticcacaulis biprosthecium]|nr:hypothetical protein [Asticcacaulis biprosthecium]
MQKNLAPAILLGLGFMLASCETTAGKDYTVRTEKWSHAPREKFYRIVKVPKTPAKTECERAKDTDMACPAE